MRGRAGTARTGPRAAPVPDRSPSVAAGPVWLTAGTRPAPSVGPTLKGSPSPHPPARAGGHAARHESGGITGFVHDGPTDLISRVISGTSRERATFAW
jgi:hypothetical protein